MSRPAAAATGRVLRVALGVVACLAVSLPAAAQSRVDFHLLPAVSTGPLDPDWSPDGARLAFAMRGDVWTVPAAGGTARALTAGPHYQSEPAWSPDGERIALTVDRDGNLDVGVIDAGGGEIDILTRDAAADFAPAWSDDGNSLYFVTRRNGNLDIYRLDLDSRSVEPFVAGPLNEYQPAVSPDGGRLAYVAQVEGRIGSGGIWVKTLPDGPAELVHFEESSYRMKPSWSADGTSLAYISDAAGGNDVARVPAAGGDRVRLSEDPADEFDPAFSPDGGRIAFVSNRDGPTALHVMDAAGAVRAAWEPVDVSVREARYPSGRLRGRVVDADGVLLPARLMLVASDGRAYTEEGGFHRMVPATRTHYQHIDGSFDIELPAGRVTVEAMRGFEFAPAADSVVVPENGAAETTLELLRVATPAADGWHPGDMHVHDLHEGRHGLTHEDFFTQLQADGVGVANALIHMDGTKIMGRWSDLTGRPHPLSDEGTILRYSQEFRGYFGHVGLEGITGFQMPMIDGVPSTPFAADTLGLEQLDAARADGAVTGFMHPYNGPATTAAEVGARDIPVLAALGKADFYDVISVASRELESASVYYKLLNAGIPLAATGGTDNFSDVWYDPSGGTARTYARIEDQRAVDFDAWLEAVDRGRTFATSGPLLFLEVGGREPGEEIRLDGGVSAALTVRLRLVSITPVDTVAVIVNGVAVHEWTPDGDGPEWLHETSVELPAGGWVAARAVGPSSRYVGDAFAFAQTSPVRVVRDGRPWRSAADAAFLAEAVEQFWTLAERRNLWPTRDAREVYRDAVFRARDYYRRVALARPESEIFQRRAPESFSVELATSEGPITIELRRAWSEHGVDRFYNLVRAGFYDDVRIHRVRPNDFLQFGIHGVPEIARAWRHRRIPDDPVSIGNLRGTVGFAMGYEPDDRTTQIFINLADKPELDALGFTVIGRVIEGMDAADRVYSGYGEAAGGGIRGGRQDPVFDGGNEYLDANFPELDRIIEARILLAD